MIAISNDPISGLQRKVDYDFHWYRSNRIITIQCNVFYFDAGGNKIQNVRLNSYIRNLIASDDKVNPLTGVKLTPEQITNGDAWIYEYDFYVQVIGATAIVVPALIESIIHTRDLEGKFDI